MALIFWLSSFHSLRTGTNLIFWEIILRKLAHAGEFFILAILFWRLFYRGHKQKFQKSFWLAIILTALYALSDEWHQMFIVGREGRVLDIFFDILGSYLGLFFFSRQKKLISSPATFYLILVLFISLLGYKAWENVWVYGKYFSSVSKNEEISQKIESIQANKSIKIEEDKTEEADEKETETARNIPSTFLIKDVPFTSQAPLLVWDNLHEESCEEASIVMLAYFQAGKKLDAETAEKEIRDLVEYQLISYGSYEDTDAQLTAQLAYEFYGLDLKVVYDFSLEDLKKYLSLGKPIIVPAAGRELKNPFFTPPGPLYHNLVLIGYGDGKIITNDPGTRRGQNYIYDEKILFEAIHDFPGKKEDILKGRKAMLILQ